ncbi:hypothetical protein Tco_0461462, partial [Tanacetum coccineum]
KQRTPSNPPPSDDKDRDEIAEATLLKEEIEKMVEGEKDEESYASEFADSILNDDVDDSGTKIEPGSHKENPKNVDDDEIEKEKKDEGIEKEEKDDTIEKTNKVDEEKDIVTDVMGSSKELTATVSPTTAITSKDSSTTKCKKRFISYKTKNLPGSIAGMCRRHADPPEGEKHGEKIFWMTKANEKIGIFCEWKTNSTDDEAFVKWIENGAKTGIIRLNLVKFNYFSKPRQSREMSPSIPVERVREYEFNGALGS